MRVFGFVCLSARRVCSLALANSKRKHIIVALVSHVQQRSRALDVGRTSRRSRRRNRRLGRRVAGSLFALCQLLPVLLLLLPLLLLLSRSRLSRRDVATLAFRAAALSLAFRAPRLGRFFFALVCSLVSALGSQFKVNDKGRLVVLEGNLQLLEKGDWQERRLFVFTGACLALLQVCGLHFCKC